MHIKQSTTKSQVKKALFLDRDGVINVNYGYVYEIENFHFIDGIFDLVKQANQLGYEVVIVTNQSGIGRAYYNQKQFTELTAWMIDMFEQHGAHISRVYYCPHHPSEAKGSYLQNCHCRKPEIGMLEQAKSELGVELNQSIMVGDKLSDVECGLKAGLKKVFWFTQSSEHDAQNLQMQSQVVKIDKLTNICLKNV